MLTEPLPAVTFTSVEAFDAFIDVCITLGVTLVISPGICFDVFALKGKPLPNLAT